MKGFEIADMEHWMGPEFWWQFQLVGNLAHSLHDLEWALIPSHKGLMNTLVAKCYVQLGKDHVSNFELHVPTLTICLLLGPLLKLMQTGSG